MRNSRAKEIKKKVLEAMYGEVDDTQRKAILKDRKFKTTYRRAKKNYHLNKVK